MPASPTRPRWTIAALCTLCVTLAAPAGAEWRRVDTPNFVVIGDAGAGTLRDIAVRFEGFRETLSRVLAPHATATAVPTVVVVFPSDRAFTPFKPLFEGKPIRLAGLFVGGRDINYIALVADGRPDRLRVVFHEYAHLVISNLTHNLPAWLNEGLAEYYSTYESRRGGREALLGNPIDGHLLRLAEATTLLPLEELLRVTRSSPLYNEGDRRSIFYAQSWALTHLLLLGEPNRSAELGAFVAQVAEGAPPMQAWARAFGSVDIERELYTYVRRQGFRALLYTFPEKLSAIDAPAVSLAPVDAGALLADFLVQQRRYDDADERLRTAAALDAGSARVAAVAARLDIARREHAIAERRLLTLGEVDDWLIAYTAGTALADLLEDQGAAPGAAHLEAARRLFAIARRDRPELPNALARFASIDVQETGGPSDDTVAAIERARRMAPGRHDYALLHARILAQRAEFPAARHLLGPFLSTAWPPDIREPARRLMGYVVQLEAAHAAAAARHPAGARTAAAPDQIQPAGGAPGVPSGPPGRFQPIYRQLEDGERRLEGELERIECLRGGAAIFHLRTADGPARAVAPQMTKVDFITYRDDVAGSIACGALKTPLPVYLSWRPAADGSDNRVAVAVEFVVK